MNWVYPTLEIHGRGNWVLQDIPFGKAPFPNVGFEIELQLPLGSVRLQDIWSMSNQCTSSGDLIFLIVTGIDFWLRAVLLWFYKLLVLLQWIHNLRNFQKVYMTLRVYFLIHGILKYVVIATSENLAQFYFMGSIVIR